MNDQSNAGPTGSRHLRDVADMFTELGQQLKAAEAETAYHAITRVAVDRIPAAYRDLRNRLRARHRGAVRRY